VVTIKKTFHTGLVWNGKSRNRSAKPNRYGYQNMVYNAAIKPMMSSEMAIKEGDNLNMLLSISKPFDLTPLR